MRCASWCRHENEDGSMTTSQKMIEAFFWGSIFCTVVSFAVAVLYLADVASRKSATELRNDVRAPAAACWRRDRYDNYHPHYAHAAFIATLLRAGGEESYDIPRSRRRDRRRPRAEYRRGLVHPTVVRRADNHRCAGGYSAGVLECMSARVSARPSSRASPPRLFHRRACCRRRCTLRRRSSLSMRSRRTPYARCTVL